MTLTSDPLTILQRQCLLPSRGSVGAPEDFMQDLADVFNKHKLDTLLDAGWYVFVDIGLACEWYDKLCDVSVSHTQVL